MMRRRGKGGLVVALVAFAIIIRKAVKRISGKLWKLLLQDGGSLSILGFSQRKKFKFHRNGFLISGVSKGPETL